jgi:hypothetical protein
MCEALGSEELLLEMTLSSKSHLAIVAVLAINHKLTNLISLGGEGKRRGDLLFVEGQSKHIDLLLLFHSSHEYQRRSLDSVLTYHHDDISTDW